MGKNMCANNVNISIERFASMSRADISIIVALIQSGDAVGNNPDTIHHLLSVSHWIAVARAGFDHSIVGVSVLKNPNEGYRRDTFSNAKKSIHTFENAPELGYVTVAESWRKQGISRDLVHALACKIEAPTYATTGSATMIKHLKEAGFKRVGDEWQGRNGQLSLLVI
jgi:predicted GNAT family N-acyltransferase